MARLDTVIRGWTVVDAARVPPVWITSRGLRALLLSGVVAAAACGCATPTAMAAMETSIPSQLGQVVKLGVGGLEARVLDVSPLSLNTANRQPFGPSKYETVTYEVANPTPYDELFMPRLQTLVADHQSYSPDRDATTALGETLIPRVIGPKTTVRCKIAFAIPQTAKNLEAGLVNTEGVEWRINAH
jgi:hypothetical protein